jgi:Na+-driven multidrug efflux pump
VATLNGTAHHESCKNNEKPIDKGKMQDTIGQLFLLATALLHTCLMLHPQQLGVAGAGLATVPSDIFAATSYWTVLHKRDWSSSSSSSSSSWRRSKNLGPFVRGEQPY